MHVTNTFVVLFFASAKTGDTGIILTQVLLYMVLYNV